jgi:type 1 fimbria pilin
LKLILLVTGALAACSAAAGPKAASSGELNVIAFRCTIVEGTFCSPAGGGEDI